MKVTLGEEGLGKTWQTVFPKTASCNMCGGVARIGFVAHEGIDGKDGIGPNKAVCSLHDNVGVGGYWLHDCCCVAVYFCVECLNPTALYNQA